MKIRIFYIPFSSKESADLVIASLLSQRLIACGNVIDAQSSYTWSDTLCKEQEFVAILKSIDSKKDVIEVLVNELHTYDVPAIISWLVDCNPTYAEWVNSQVV